jgi:hypothetical protein
LIILLGPLLGCAGTDGSIKTTLGQEFTLRLGQTAQIEGEQLSITFNGVSEDSRCPRDVLCIRAGEVKCEMTVTYQGSSSSITLIQPGMTEPASETYRGYRIIYSVEPYPDAGKPISPAEYRLNLTVQKLPQSSD